MTAAEITGSLTHGELARVVLMLLDAIDSQQQHRNLETFLHEIAGAADTAEGLAKARRKTRQFPGDPETVIRALTSAECEAIAERYMQIALGHLDRRLTAAKLAELTVDALEWVRERGAHLATTHDIDQRWAQSLTSKFGVAA